MGGWGDGWVGEVWRRVLVGMVNCEAFVLGECAVCSVCVCVCARVCWGSVIRLTYAIYKSRQ